MGDTADTAKFTGCTGVSKFDSVKVVGERGTIWMGYDRIGQLVPPPFARIWR